MFNKYRENACSSQWDASNRIAEAAPAMDEPLAKAISDEQAFSLLVAFVRGADWNGFGPMELANSSFAMLAKLKEKSQAFAAANSAAAQAIIDAANVSATLAQFVAKYLS